VRQKKLTDTAYHIALADCNLAYANTKPNAEAIVQFRPSADRFEGVAMGFD
jgi:hypothetical protein